jgi:2Fe-2S ferredoxin
MFKVTYVAFSGESHSVEVPDGENVMRGALYNNLDGIAGDCGGASSCATCHCYVDDAWATRVDAAVTDAERDLLEGAASEVRPTSRLSCQIVMSVELDGLVVHLPERQY